MPWSRHYHADCWWCHFPSGVSFWESDPSWNRYKDPESGLYWWQLQDETGPLPLWFFEPPNNLPRGPANILPQEEKPFPRCTWPLI